MSDHQYIRSLQDKDNVDAVYLVKDKVVGVGKNGKSFLALQVGDKTGTVDARVWDRVDEISQQFETGDLIRIRGAVQIFQNRKQMVVHKLDRQDPAGFNMDEYIANSSRNVEDMWTELQQIIADVKNDHIRQLLKDTLEDIEIKNLFMSSPAARSIHHAWRGGLLEHVVSICKIMNFLAVHYPTLNRDFLIFGAIYHDIGKVYELSIESGIQYTDRGRLIGHITMGCELIDKKSSRILGFTEELRDLLKHVVLSHHGRLDYGSPKRPKFLEAMVVAMVDDLDSKISTIQTILDDERGSGAKWSRYNEMFERYFLLDDLKEKF